MEYFFSRKIKSAETPSMTTGSGQSNRKPFLFETIKPRLFFSGAGRRRRHAAILSSTAATELQRRMQLLRMHWDNERDEKEERQIHRPCFCFGLVSVSKVQRSSKQKDADYKDADYSVVSQWHCKSCVSICTFVPVKVLLYQ